MHNLLIPYGKGALPLDTRDNIRAVLRPAPHSTHFCGTSDLEQALLFPIGSPALSELAKDARRLLIITSDHTRPMPSAVTLPLLLKHARMGNPGIEIRILVATGCHRAMTPDEMRKRFGDAIFFSETLVNHDASDDTIMVYKGVMPSGQPLYLNGLVDWADLVIAEGFIEPHFFAGFSGGRKSVLPGIASRRSIYANHCASFIAFPDACAGTLVGNPIHRDMLFSAQAARLRFILNVTLDSAHNITAVFAGDPERAHAAGCDYVMQRQQTAPVIGDIVITSNGGYPLDQNIYQAVKGMTTAQACTVPGGVIIMAAECADGHGGDGFYRYFSEGRTPEEILQYIEKTPAAETKPDQWQAQILARILCKNRVIMVTDTQNRTLVESMGMGYAPVISEAVREAKTLMGENAGIIVIPDGVSTIIR